MTKNNQHSRNKQLKVYKKFVRRKSINLCLPEIRMCGKWLLECGFTPGKTITLKSEKSKIEINIIDL